MKKGDIVLVSFPFSDLSGSKLRPAIILIAGVTDVTVCFITTQMHWKEEFDIPLIPSYDNGLKKISLLRISELSTIDKDLILGRIGILEKKYLSLLNENLIKVFQLN